MYTITCLFILGIPNTMALLMLLGYLMCNVLLAWATLQQPYVSKTLSSPPHKTKMIGYIWSFLSHNQKFNEHDHHIK